MVAVHAQHASAGTASTVHDHSHYDPYAAHMRLLREHARELSSGAEEFLTAEVAFDLLAAGQVVNCTIGPRTTGFHSAGVQGRVRSREPGWNVFTGQPIDDVDQGVEPSCSVATVLGIRRRTNELVVSVDAAPSAAMSGNAALIDFTNPSGTYQLACTITQVRLTWEVRLVLSVQQATRVQLRRFARIPALLPVLHLEVRLPSGDAFTTNGEIVDLSLGGLGLLVSEPLLHGAHVGIAVDLPGRSGRLVARGRIVVPPGPAEARAGIRPKAGLGYRRGIQFAPLAEHDLNRLRQALYRRQVELTRLRIA
ncbi:MAG: PilZ domain-containing protein [Chloroflexi bacterium]|nr:PilZ domain-containing protein [Chloroflexota bacterium]